MNFFEISETISLNTSLTIHPSGLAPEEPTSKNNILEPSEVQNPSLQLLQLPNVQSRCEVGSVGGKSNYSSINNILPCPDSDQSKNRTQESQFKPVEKSQLPVQASRNPELMTMRQNMSAAPRVTAADKPPMRASARPPLNPNEVAKGLSMLHSRVDELLRKKSVSRGREVSSNQNEKHQRALSTDARAETIIHHPFILTSFPKEPHTPDLLTGRTCHSIEIGFNRQHEEQNLTARLFDDQREISPQPSSLRFQTEIYQDLSLKEKSISNPVNVSSPPKPRYHLMGKVPAYTPAIRATYSIEMLKQNSALQRTLDTGLDKIEAKHKPKYDEKKLDAIVNRIRSRNSVSPTPGRGSVTETDSASVPRFSLTLNNNSVCAGRRETEPDNRNNVSGYSNWQLNTGPKERERSIEDIMSQRNFNMTANASMLDVLGKKRSASNPKFTDMPIEGNKLTTTDKTNPVIADIIKELKNRIPTNFKEASKKESYLERTRNAVGVQSKLKAEELPFNAGIYQSSYSNKKNMESNVKRGREGLGASSNVGYQKDVVKTESDAGSNSKRGVPESMYQFNKQDLINKLAIEREKTLNLNKRLRQGFERTEKNGLEEQSPINRHGEESLTWDESAGAEMFNTTIRVNHLQDDTNNISDFDFERNRLETLGQDASREFMLNTSKLADEYGSRYGAKRQRVEEKRGSSIGLGSEKILSKTDMMRKGRFAY